MSFEAILPQTLAYEGGKVDDKDDPGGRTAYGITQRVFTDFLVSAGLPPRDVWTITTAERDEIYRLRYWRPVERAATDDQFRMAAFDYAVHSGPSRAIAHLSAAPTVREYLDRRRAFLRGLAQRRPTSRKYLKGWLRRVARLQAFLEAV